MKDANRVLGGNLREGDHLAYPGVRWEVNIKMYLQEVEWWGVLSGLIWLRIGTGGRHL
jgi:hypothetical protein